jgi:hypothetical protein
VIQIRAGSIADTEQDEKTEGCRKNQGELIGKLNDINLALTTIEA